MQNYLWTFMLACLTVTLTACYRNETSQISIRVPEMRTELDARIVTNAALDEVVGSLTRINHDYEFDLEHHVVLYHESRQLLHPQYQKMLVDSLSAAGFDSRVLKAGFNPIPPLGLPDGSVLQIWPDRFTAVLSIPELDTVTEANIVADALAYVRNGGDDPRVLPNLETRSMDIAYNNAAISERNISEAIACVGYSANTVPPAAAPQGWDLLSFTSP